MQFESFIYVDDKYRDNVEVPVSVTCDIHVERDGYGTGDSPTLIEVNNLKISRDNEDITKYIDSSTLEEIEDEAVEYYMELNS